MSANARGRRAMFLVAAAVTIALVLPATATASVGWEYIRQFGQDQPFGLAVGQTGNVYVADMQKVRKYDPTGVLLQEFGNVNSGYADVAVDKNDNVFCLLAYSVAGVGHNRIDKYASDGTLLKSWGSYGSGPGEFRALSLAVDKDGFVYVADNLNDRIQKFTSEGVFVKTWGSTGTGDLEFNRPYDIAISTTGKVFVADSENSRVQVYTTSGTFIETLGGYGYGPGLFWNVFSIAADDAGRVYVIDGGQGRIQSFSPNGEPTILYDAATPGFVPGSFELPRSIAVDRSSFIYVADEMTEAPWSGRVQKFARVSSTAAGTGGNVQVIDEESGVKLKFDNITGSGMVKIMPTEIKEVPELADLGSGKKLLNAGGYEISFTGEKLGSVSVEFKVKDTMANMDTVKVLHWDGVKWVDSTILVEKELGQAKGSVNSFSPFALVEGDTLSTGVNVWANVPPSLTFAIAPVEIPDGGSATDASIDFGTVLPAVAKTGSHRLSVSTNAPDGFRVTAEEDRPLSSGIYAIPDVTGDAASITETVAGSWEASSTYGFGYTLSNVNGTTAAFTSGFKQFANVAASETPQPIMDATVPSDQLSVDVGYRLNTSGTQPAGAYTNTLSYVALGRF